MLQPIWSIQCHVQMYPIHLFLRQKTKLQMDATLTSDKSHVITIKVPQTRFTIREDPQSMHFMVQKEFRRNAGKPRYMGSNLNHCLSYIHHALLHVHT